MVAVCTLDQGLHTRFAHLIKVYEIKYVSLSDSDLHIMPGLVSTNDI